MVQESLSITMVPAVCKICGGTSKGNLLCDECAQKDKERKAARRRELAKAKAKKKQDAEAYRKRRESEFAVMGWLPKGLEAKVQEITDKYFEGNRGFFVRAAVETALDLHCRGLLRFIKSNGPKPNEIIYTNSSAQKPSRRWWAFWRKAA